MQLFSLTRTQEYGEWWCMDRRTAGSYFPDPLYPTTIFFIFMSFFFFKVILYWLVFPFLFVFNRVTTARINQLSKKLLVILSSNAITRQTSNVAFKQGRFNKGSLFRRNKLCKENPQRSDTPWLIICWMYQPEFQKGKHYSGSETTCVCSWISEIQPYRDVRIFTDPPLTPTSEPSLFHTLQHPKLAGTGGRNRLASCPIEHKAVQSVFTCSGA